MTCVCSLKRLFAIQLLSSERDLPPVGRVQATLAGDVLRPTQSPKETLALRFTG
jgi:hypothetical protein